MSKIRIELDHPIFRRGTLWLDLNKPDITKYTKALEVLLEHCKEGYEITIKEEKEK